MSRQKQRTRSAIFRAVSRLLEKKRFNQISVQEIIDEANVGRTTFYAHFETKDALLKAMCNNIFNHVFSEDLSSETTHDFSQNKDSLSAKLTHVLYHIHDSGPDIIRILSSESGSVFLDFFKQDLVKMFEHHIAEIPSPAPRDYILNFLVDSFSDTINWWIKAGTKYSPEEITDFFLSMLALQLPVNAD